MRRATALERLPMTMGYFRLILRAFGDTLSRRAAILEGTGVSERELSSPTAEISLFQQLRQIDNVARVHGEAWPVLHPEIWRPMSHGALGVAVSSAATIAEALDVLCRFGHVRAPFYRMHMSRRGDRVTLTRELTVPLTMSQERALSEAADASVHAMLGAVLGHEPREVTYTFTASRPEHAERLERVLGRNLRFGEKKNAVVVPAVWLDAESPMADPVLYRGGVAELERALERLERPRDLRARVVRLLHTMPEGKMSAAGVARALAVSRRTLVRRLAEVDTSYRHLLDDELKRRASAMLRAGHLRRDTIAERLGYRDPTSFSRACRRWFGPRRNGGARRKRIAG